MGGQLIRLPSCGPILLTKKQLAAHLGRSERWIELRVREGMPAEPATDRYGRRRYNLELVEGWLTRGRPPRASRVDRLAALELQVAELNARLTDLTRAG